MPPSAPPHSSPAPPRALAPPSDDSQLALDSEDPPADSKGPRFAKLDNSLRIAIAPDHGRPLVSVQVWYRIGAVDDDPDRPGICHLARTLMEQRRPIETDKVDARVHFEARTLQDACVFHWTAPPQQFATILATEAERMSPREATTAEISRAFDAAARGPETLPDTIAFAEHPYARPPSTIDPALRGTTAVRINEYLRRWFVPGNACIVIVGDVDPNDAIDRLREHLGSVPWADVPRRAEPPLLEIASQELSKTEAVVAGIDFIWPAHRAGAFENRALDILMHHLTNSVDGPLASRALKIGALALRWRRDQWRYAGVMTLSIDDPNMNADRAAAYRAAVREVLAAIARNAPDPIAFDRARALAARDERLGRLNFGAWALALGYAEVVGGDMVDAATDPERLTTSGVDQLCAAARRLAEAPIAARTRSSRLTPATSRPAPPPTTSPATQPAVSEQRDVYVRASPGCGGDLIVVRTLIRGDAIDPTGVLALMAAGSQRWSVEQYRDYLTYHGLDLLPVVEWIPPARTIGLESRGPLDRLAGIIELHRDLLCTPRTDATIDASALRTLDQRAGVAGKRGESLLCAPPGWIGWRTGLPLPSGDAAATRAALESLQHWTSLTVEIAGDLSADEARNAVQAAWPSTSIR